MSGLSAAGDVDISDVTSDSINADILRKLKNNDPEFTRLLMGDARPWALRVHHEYIIEGARGMEVLGYHVGRSTIVKDLWIYLSGDVNIAPFLSGLQSNRSIQSVSIENSHIPRDFFRMLTPFIKGNPNLVRFYAGGCEMDAEQYRSLSSALREGRLLKEFEIGGLVGDGHYDHEESIIANIEALKMHPHLEDLQFRKFVMGRNACAALSDLLRHVTGMEALTLDDNLIDDSGLEALVDGLANCRVLRELDLSSNPSITVRGWRALSSLLEDPDSSLQKLDLQESGINVESAIIFANALARNNTLTALYLDSEDVENIGDEGRKAFSEVLCDTSSVNSTFLSNHTLHYVCEIMDEGENDLPDDLAALLALNDEDDKKRVAFRKVLSNHDDFDMHPFFEWDLKVLPFVIEWFESAAGYGIEREAKTRKRKLAAIYQFVRGMPELAIDGITGASKKSAQTAGEKRSYSAACE